MIFPKMNIEKTLQENDKTRLKGMDSFITTDEAAITLVEIEPHTGDGFIDVTAGLDNDKWYLDWAYASAGTKTVSLRITTDGAPTTVTKDIEVITEADDKLFSDDDDLLCHEHDILEYIPKGRNSWMDKHRCSQEAIVDHLNEQGIYKYDTATQQNSLDYELLTKLDIYNIEEVRKWSKYQTLELIFESMIVSPEDIFTAKSELYKGMKLQSLNRAIIRLDTNQDGAPDRANNMRNYRVVRR